jgi:hypothetical protein
VHIRQAYPVRLWTGKQGTELPGDRIIVLSWKGNTKTGREAHSARYISIPEWSPDLTGNDKAYVELLIDAVEMRQKLTAHKYVTMMLEKNGGVCNDIPMELIEPKQILADFLSEESDSDSSRGKLNAEQIMSWYKENLSHLVMLAIAEKSGMITLESKELSKEQEKKLEQMSNGYQAVLSRLAAPTPKVNISEAKQLKMAIELLGDAKDTHNIARKLERKLDNIINPPEEKQISLASL